MVAPICIGAQEMTPIMPKIFSSGKRSLAQDLMLRKSPGSFDIPKHVVVVMDGLKEPSIKLLEWVLQNFGLEACCTITLIGVMPWLNIPLSCKASSDNWMMDIEDLVVTKREKTEWRSDVKYQKVEPLIELCRRKFGVIPQVETLMGFPIKLLVGERIASLHANLVVIDRHHDRKNFEYYVEKLVPCNIVAMNDKGEFDIIKTRSDIENDDYGDSPAPAPAPAPKLMISGNWMKYFKLKRSTGKLAKERKTYFGG